MAGRRQRLAERRKALGFTQEILAGQLGIDRTTVGRWERGDSEPYPYIRPRLARILGISANELDAFLARDTESERPNAARRAAPVVIGGTGCAPESMGELDDMYRRELLRLLSVAGALVALPTVAEPEWTAWAHEAGDIRQHELLNSHLWQVFGLATSKRLVYPVVHEQLAVLIGQMNRPCSAQTHRQLSTLICELFQLVGEIFFDSNQYTDAAHCYTLAADAGREARSPDRWACALTRHAFVCMYDRQYTDAASVLDAAAAVARRGDSQLSTRYWVAAVQAQAAAGRGDLDECKRALDTAEGVLGLNEPASPGGWLRFDGSRLAEERGTSYLSAGHADLAETALTEALQQAVSLRRRGSLLTDLATLSIQRRDLHQLLHYGGGAIDIAEQTGSSGYVGRKLQTLNTQLQPFLTDHRVAQLSDRIAPLSATA